MYTYALFPFILIGFDIITGLTKAVYKKKINSTKLRKGLFAKIGEILAICACWIFDFGLAYYNIDLNIPLYQICCVYVSFMEMLSIIENLLVLNPNLKKIFTNFIDKIKEALK